MVSRNLQSWELQENRHDSDDLWRGKESIDTSVNYFLWVLAMITTNNNIEKKKKTLMLSQYINNQEGYNVSSLFIICFSLILRRHKTIA